MGRSRILLVDDEPEVLDALKDVLERSLYVEVVAAASGPAALEAMRSTVFDLVISDFRMPLMDGLQFLRKAGELHPQVPLVLMTAFPHLDLALDSLNQTKVRQFLTKPIDRDLLVDVVGRLTTHRKSQRQHHSALGRAAKGPGNREPSDEGLR